MSKPQKQVSARDKKMPHDKMWRIIRSDAARIHFVGIGGVSMRALARLTLLYHGARVSGSDREAFYEMEELISLGASVTVGHSPSLVDGASLVVYSHAVHEDNPELLRAAELSIPAVTRAEYLGVLMSDYTARIGVSGTHGKSTTTAMLDLIFSCAGIAPTVVSGALLPCGSTMKAGEHTAMIYEACEYKDSFLRFSPTHAIALNLELDHTDYFKDIGELRESFRRAMSHASECAVINYDDENLSKIIPGIKSRVVTFGQRVLADYRYEITGFLTEGYEFDVLHGGAPVGSFRLNVPGVYNVTNATAAIVCALEYGIDVDIIKKAIAHYAGIQRRLEYIGDRHLRRVYYDYAHHPTEIASCINAVKMLTHGLVTVIFRPHTYSRTKSLWEDFKRALSLADHIVLTDIYPAREAPIEGITSARLAYEIGDNAVLCSDEDVLHTVDSVTSGAIIIMGAGNMDAIRSAIIKD